MTSIDALADQLIAQHEAPQDMSALADHLIAQHGTDQPDQRGAAIFKMAIDEGLSPEKAKERTVNTLKALDAIGAGQGEQDYGAPTPFRSDYLASPTEVRASRGNTVGKAEAIARGVVKGVTLRNADEIVGYMTPEGASPSTEPYRIAKGIPGKTNPNFEQERQAARKQYNARDVAAEQDQPWTSRLSEIFGSSAIAPLFGKAKTAVQSFVTGAKMGAPYAFGASDASAAEEPGRLALETVGGGALGGVTGVAAKGATDLVGYGVNKAKDYVNDRLVGVPRGITAADAALQGKTIPLPAASRRAAQETADAIAAKADAPSALAPGMTVRTAFEQTKQLQKTLEGVIKEPLDDLFDPAQATGSRSAALRQLRLRQFPATMDQAQAQYAKSLDTGARILDRLVDHVAADPAALGRGNVSKGVSTALKNNIKNIYTTTSESARPYYTAYENTAGGVDAEPIINFYRDEVAKRTGLNDSFTNGLKHQLAELEKTGAGGGLSVIEANNKRMLANEVIAGQSSMFDGVDMDVQGGFAKKLRYVIDGVFDSAEKHGPADAVKYLRKGNAIWSAGQKAAEEAKTGTVMRIIGATAKDPGATEGLPKQMLTMGEDQVRGIFRLLNETDPAMAKQARAQMLEEAFVQIGKPGRNAELTREVGGTRLAPARAFGPSGVLTKAESAMQAAYEGDPKAKFALAHAFYMLKRLSFGPGLEGSQTAPLAADAVAEHGQDALLALANVTGFGKPARAVLGVVANMTGDNAALADALSTPQGIKATSAALSVAMKAKAGEPISDKIAREAMALLTSSGVMAYSEAKQRRTPDPRLGEPSPPMERLQESPSIASEGYPP